MSYETFPHETSVISLNVQDYTFLELLWQSNFLISYTPYVYLNDLNTLKKFCRTNDINKTTMKTPLLDLKILFTLEIKGKIWKDMSNVKN